MTGKKLYEIVPLSVAQTAMEAVRQALVKGTTENLEYQLIVAGGPCHFEVRTVASGPDEVLSIVRDITDAKARSTPSGRVKSGTPSPRRGKRRALGLEHEDQRDALLPQMESDARLGRQQRSADLPMNGLDGYMPKISSSSRSS